VQKELLGLQMKVEIKQIFKSVDSTPKHQSQKGFNMLYAESSSAF